MATSKTAKNKRAGKNRGKEKTSGIYLVLAAIGILLTISGVSYVWHEQTKYSFAFSPSSQALKANESSLPTNIYIPAINVSLPIDEGNVVAGIWEVSPTHATHLASSSDPGQKGNIVIYGHNKDSIFGQLRDVKIGDRIVVTTQNGLAHFYSIRMIKTVSPSEIQVVEPTDTETLTVYTCTGFLDSRRFVLQAVPSGSVN